MDTRLLTLAIEVPFLLLALGILLSFIFLIVGLFTKAFAGYRWKLAAAPFSFAFMGLLGLLATERFKVDFLNDRIADSPTLSPHYEAITYITLLCGYFLFGALGCWLALRIAHRLDREHSLQTLYKTLESRKQD